ncbi:MAG: alginate lyase family protein [Pirellulaceae bacterium]
MAEHQLRVFTQVHTVAEPADWNRLDMAYLVRYNLHYFDDLVAANHHQRLAWQQNLVRRWIEENPPLVGVGWEPYPLSLRIVNWIKWHCENQTLDSTALHNLAVQVRALVPLLEYHLLANHLLANAKALVFAGIFFGQEEGDRWLELGLRILDQQLDEQILADGGHFELSPMYHSIILEDVLDLINLARTAPDLPAVQNRLEHWKSVASRMLSWLTTMCHPDQQISFFNDAAFGVACEPLELMDYAGRLELALPAPPGNGVTHLAESGYVRVQTDNYVALLDLAHVGPAYQPGHAHADTLSFELSLFGQRMIVNSGTSIYAPGELREFQRSTAAHSTVEVDDADSSEVWGSFRVARRATPVLHSIDESADEITIVASHNGYRFLRSPITHVRTWTFGSNKISIYDALEGGYPTAKARFILHPQITANQTNRLTLSVGSQTILCEAESAAIVPCEYFPEFEVAQPSTSIVRTFLNGASQLTLEW